MPCDIQPFGRVVVFAGSVAAENDNSHQTAKARQGIAGKPKQGKAKQGQAKTRHKQGKAR